MEPDIKKPKKLWRVWKAADELEERQKEFYPSVTPKIVSILRQWGTKWEGKDGWKSLLDKHSLVHEAEESIVAIYHLMKGVSSRTNPYIAADVCGGKGLLSFLLSYYEAPNLHSIILLDKADIDWNHIHEANSTAGQEKRPPIHIWSETNLHDYDSILDRFQELPYPLAMTGIHLCKQLSPSFCGLVNGLGRDRCIYACLSPCCMPRAITAQKKNPNTSYSVPIQQLENTVDRNARRDYMERRERLKRKPKTGPCFHCKAPDHNLIDCQLLPTLPKEEQTQIRQAWHVATIPCWNCLELGHYKSECPRNNDSSIRNSKQPPMVDVDVTNVLKGPKPYETYCNLLTNGLPSWQCQVIETELENQEKHQEGNWNSGRKSIYIVMK
ncbi:unnamed protein product [Cylindrotheca closterium]|uniref:CCHC-type domain-containing protein n=1 Tax=Cylindrotheca closterium TaxID=2856 RepID=A0AAD2G6R9_9STRA|nr:unnamed protein product [Cylindrotheca closterium]